MTDHECGCSHFGPGPHDADLRHPNPKACEHAEMAPVTVARLAAARGALRDIRFVLPVVEAGRSADAWMGHGTLERLIADLDSIVDPSL